MLVSTAAITTGQAPADRATVKTAHLPMKPAVSGMPAIEQEEREHPATSGDALPRPAQRRTWVASPPASRTSVTTAKAPIIAKP